jgi:hypothetical protein
MALFFVYFFGGTVDQTDILTSSSLTKPHTGQEIRQALCHLSHTSSPRKENSYLLFSAAYYLKKSFLPTKDL